MTSRMKSIVRTVAALLVVCVCASAQQDAGLVYSPRAKHARSSFRVKLTNGIGDTPGTLYLEQRQVTIRNKSGDDIVIPDEQLLDAVDVSRGRSMPYIHLSAIQGCTDGRDAMIFLMTTGAWDAVAGVASLFHRKRHFLTINYSRDGETRSETVQVSGRDAQNLVHELQLRRGIAFVPGS
jgi:hypothetical protein